MNLAVPALAVQIGRKWLALGGGICLALVLIAVAGAIGFLAVRALFRRLRPDPDGHRTMMHGLGFEPTGPHRWTRPVPGVPLTFEVGDEGWSWTGRLPRYATLNLEVEERVGQGLDALSNGAFLTQDAELDERFVVRSDRPSLTLELLSSQEVGDQLLALPYVQLILRGDEIVWRDPARRNVAQWAGGARPGTARALAAEARLHEAITQLTIAVMRTLP